MKIYSFNFMNSSFVVNEFIQNIFTYVGFASCSS